MLCGDSVAVCKSGSDRYEFVKCTINLELEALRGFVVTGLPKFLICVPAIEL